MMYGHVRDFVSSFNLMVSLFTYESFVAAKLQLVVGHERE